MTSPLEPAPKVSEAERRKSTLRLLEAHFRAFHEALPFAADAGHTVPCDTKSWSQILVSVLTGVGGRARRKGSDLDDGSDVKAANVWNAIDTPRFNGCIPAGRTSKTSRKPLSIEALDETPVLYFVLWDYAPPAHLPRCRIWVVRPPSDPAFRTMCAGWYADVIAGKIGGKTPNFQLHPPRNSNSNIFTNTYGNLEYPLLFSAVRRGDAFVEEHFDASALISGICRAT